MTNALLYPISNIIPTAEIRLILPVSVRVDLEVALPLDTMPSGWVLLLPNAGSQFALVLHSTHRLQESNTRKTDSRLICATVSIMKQRKLA
jgi:hypothetical protein